RAGALLRGPLASYEGSLSGAVRSPDARGVGLWTRVDRGPERRNQSQFQVVDVTTGRALAPPWDDPQEVSSDRGMSSDGRRVLMQRYDEDDREWNRAEVWDLADRRAVAALPQQAGGPDAPA